MRYLSILALSLLCATAAAAQHEHHAGHHAVAENARLTVGDYRAGNRVTLRIGPLDLPAHTDHTAAAQPRDDYWEIPFDGWLVAYHPSVTDEQGNALPGRLLHHVAFWNTSRSDFLCSNKEEHIFGAGGEMNQWPELPGFGYPVKKGDRIRVNSMWHNPTGTRYPRAYLEVQVQYQKSEDAAPPRRSVYPTWFDVQECRDSGYDLAPGANVTTGQFTLKHSGTLLGLGGHLHDYGVKLEVTNATRNEAMATLASTLDEAGRILAMPIVTFLERGGYRLTRGETVRVAATYDNRTGKPLPDGAMGIAVGYFLPDNDAEMAAHRRASPTAKN